MNNLKSMIILLKQSYQKTSESQHGDVKIISKLNTDCNCVFFFFFLGKTLGPSEDTPI